MKRQRSVWREVSRVLLGYQALVAVAVTVFSLWLVSAGFGCGSQCGLEALIGVLGFVWLAQAIVAGVAVITLFVLTTRWASRGAPIAILVVEALLFLPAIRFYELMGPFGLPEFGRYAIGAAIGAALAIVVLSILELLASDRWLTSHRSMAVALFAAIPFAAAAVPDLASAYSSAQIGADGFPVGPVTAQFVRDRGSKLPIAYPGANVTSTAASAEGKDFNRYRMASWEERLAKNGPKADAELWYQQSLEGAGWRLLPCAPSACKYDFELVFSRGTRECLTVLVTSDGVGQIVVDYEITPSAKPLSGDPTADRRYCTGQY
jgi:hypothetical protein